MAVVKFDVSGTDPEKASQSFEPPKPGVYLAKVAEINSGFSKNDDGKPDRQRPRLEVVYHIADGDYKNAPLWDYLSFSEDSQWRMDQFLQAVGVSSKKKRKGSFDTDSLLGKIVKVRVKADTNQSGDYRAKVGGVMSAPQEGEDYEDEEPDGEEDEPGEDEDGEDEDEETNAVDYSTMSIKDLRIECKSRDLETGGAKPALIARLEEADAAAAPSDDDDTDAGDETGEVPDDGYDEMSIKDLRDELVSRELDGKGSKPVLIARLRENDEEPF